MKFLGKIDEAKDIVTSESVTSSLYDKVDKVGGKQLSTNDYTDADKEKLASISEGAEANVQSDWNATSGDAFIKNKPNLALVATSGNYDDLGNKPTIPSAVTESTVRGWGFTKNTGTYNKPSTGIPKGDLDVAVQESLSKADSALQSYTEQYQGTVTGVLVNGEMKQPYDGIVNIGNVPTSIDTEVSSYSTNPVENRAIKSYVDRHSRYQIIERIDVPAVNSDFATKDDVDKMRLREESYKDASYLLLEPNVLYRLIELHSLTVAIKSPEPGYVGYYVMDIVVANTIPTVNLPTEVLWENGINVLNGLQANKTYRITIMNNMASAKIFY